MNFCNSIDESTPSAFHIGDEVIDDQGRTGVISGEPYMNHIHVNFYNGGEEVVKMSNLQLNDYAGSDEEKNDLDDMYGGDVNEEVNVVKMTEWLQRRAGILK
mgnify:CR=1 FL=1